MTGKAPLISLNNGLKMPALGLGVLHCTPDQTANAVEIAIGNGYRLIDTAAAYGNEKLVGEGIARSGIDRSEVFVTTKLWITDYGYERAVRAFDASLGKLGLDYVDLYLLHWPIPSDFETTVESYRAAEKLLDDGLVRAIGVSNFTATQLENLMTRTKVVPAVNQVELHPLFNQHELRDVHKRLGIVTQSWSPIGGTVRRSGHSGAARDPLTHPAIITMATKYHKTAAQVVLRWHIDHSLSPIPKSERPERIAGNIDIFDFVLSDDDMAAIDAMDTGIRSGPDPDIFDVSIAPKKTEN
jgi:diketogulonate reductase-like aldo/keto reductase